MYLYFLKISPRVNIKIGPDCIIEYKNPLKMEHLPTTLFALNGSEIKKKM